MLQKIRVGAALLAAIGWTGMTAEAQADLIDFESGYAEQDVADIFLTATNVVTVALTSGGIRSSFIAGVGAPRVAFEPDDTPADAIRPGRFFLTSGSGIASDYRLGFANPITDLSGDVYEVAGDQSTSVGDQVVLELYGDAAGTQLVGSDVFTVLDGVAYSDGHSIRLTGPGARRRDPLPDRAARHGNGIDNIAFTTVPEPTAGALLLLGLAGLRLLRR